MARQPPRSKPAPTGPPQGKSAHLIIGELGEDLVADWVRSQGGIVLAQRWHCATGELDIVAQLPPGFSGWADATETVIAFIEVKTRRRGNWDKGGLLAITPQKQNKLWRTAQFFLKKHPRLRELPCRFDVALVQCQQKSQKKSPNQPAPNQPEQNQPAPNQPAPNQPARPQPPSAINPAEHQLSPKAREQPPGAIDQNPMPDVQQKRPLSQEKQPIKLGEAVRRGEYRLTLQQYWVDAFTL